MLRSTSLESSLNASPAFFPIAIIESSSLVSAIYDFAFLTILELKAPHKPRLEVITTRHVRLVSRVSPYAFSPLSKVDEAFCRISVSLEA